MVKAEKSFTNDTELISACRAGDEEAFLLLVRKHESLIARTIQGMLGNCSEVEDLAQETFIRFFENIENFRQEAQVSTYLTRIAINLSLNELRQRKRKRLFLSFTDPHDENLLTSENDTDKQEMLGYIKQAIHKLPEKLKVVLVLRIIDGYSIRETANILHVAEGTILSRLARAQEKLRLELQAMGALS